MFPTLAEVLALEVLRRGQPEVVAGADRLDNPVRWVHVSEVADIATLLRGGELVLTTGVGLPEGARELARYIGELADVGASGLVLELGRRYADRPPAAMTAAAGRHGLPLVTLGRAIPFVEVTEAVHSRIVDAQVGELRAIAEAHQRFTDMAVSGVSAEEIVHTVALMTGAPVVLEDFAHRVLAVAAAQRSSRDLLRGWEGISRQARVADRSGYDEATGWLVTTVGARGHDWGRLVVVVGQPPTERVVMIAEQAAIAVALGRLVENERESLDRQTHRTLIHAILTAGLPTADLAAQAEAAGVALAGRQLAGVVLRLREVPAAAPAARLREVPAAARLRDAAATAARAVRRQGVPALVGSVDQSTVGVLLALPARSDVDRAVDPLAAGLRRALGPREVVVAAGSTVRSAGEARRSLQEALQVADAAPAAAAGPDCFRLPDIGLRGLLYLLRDDPRLLAFADRQLAGLAAADRGLLDCLRHYLAAGRNKTVAAAAANLSRPAFYQRLARAGRALGADLDDPEACLALHIALLVDEAVAAPGGQPPSGHGAAG